jgi:hypothetical protein
MTRTEKKIEQCLSDLGVAKLVGSQYSVTEIPLRKHLPPIGIVVNFVLDFRILTLLNLWEMTVGLFLQLNVQRCLENVARLAIGVVSFTELGRSERIVRVESSVPDISTLPALPKYLLDEAAWDGVRHACVWYIQPRRRPEGDGELLWPNGFS